MTPETTPETSPDARGLILSHFWDLGDQVTTPMGTGLVVALILDIGGATMYRVRVWTHSDDEPSLPIEIECYREELR